MQVTARIIRNRADERGIPYLTLIDLDLFGPNPSDQAAQNPAVYFLLRVCQELEQTRHNDHGRA